MEAFTDDWGTGQLVDGIVQYYEIQTFIFHKE